MSGSLGGRWIGSRNTPIAIPPLIVTEASSDPVPFEFSAIEGSPTIGSLSVTGACGEDSIVQATPALDSTNHYAEATLNWSGDETSDAAAAYLMCNLQGTGDWATESCHYLQIQVLTDIPGDCVIDTWRRVSGSDTLLDHTSLGATDFHQGDRVRLSVDAGAQFDVTLNGVNVMSLLVFSGWLTTGDYVGMGVNGACPTTTTLSDFAADVL